MMFTAYDVYQMAIGNEKDHSFGINQKRTADELRVFADKIEKEEVIMQSIGVTSEVVNDDFPMSWLHIRFFERLAKKN